MPNHSGEVIIELIPQGRYVKVTAVDPTTGIEATLVGDANAPQEKLRRLAMQKLRYVMEKQKETKS